MTDENNEKYIYYINRLIGITEREGFDRNEYCSLISEICEHYRLAKGVTEFYPTAMMEKMKNGEIFCDYDNGRGEKVLLSIRIISKARARIIGTLYVETDDPERSAEELEQIETLLRIVVGFVARMRLLRIMEEFGFHDMDGFQSFRAFIRYLETEGAENRLGGKIAFHFDIQNFTIVNQEIGRQNGDKVLKNYYNMIKDTIGETGIIVRLGGDKFIGVFDRALKREVFELFTGAMVPYDEKGEKRVKVASATGVFMLPDPFMLRSPGDIMDKIIMAGNKAKRQSDGSIIIYEDRMKAENDHVKKVMTDFRKALLDEEFLVYYQPKVDVFTRKLVGAEALCRWQRNGSIVPPMEFIPILEMNSDICDLDFYMLDHVCKDIRRWLDEGREAVRISVNMSRKHLVDVDLLEHIMNIIDRNNVPHEYIEIELTETTTDVMFRDLKRVVSGLQDQGVWTAVDDFGIGYSSLNLIRDIPWNVLKVDKSFVPKDDEEEDSIAKLMFRHVISLARDIGLECVVEGVETIDQLDVLRENNCSIAQGFFFDRPLPVRDFEFRLDHKVYPE
ncbi:EAL domain, c-di-GMP-specific phosphodiesterase class I (or its enzymatically inactive variant) [Eubacterium ruminantium]|nr:EAL domain, c-di-GMP-specific phosphodiesterase class I (or its enzymatically inactive variant) [Eubacterium ruminantium]